MADEDEKKATRKFYKKLDKISREMDEHPEELIPLEEFLKKYPITEQNKDETVFYKKQPPKHCPNCGSTNIHNQELESRHPTSELYDTYCRDCQWSGDISPDIPLSKTKSLQEIIATIQKLKPHITEKYGVETIGVFGSHVTGQASQRSDIDILVTFKEEAHPGMFEFLELEEFLSDQLGSKVDLVSKDALKPHIGKHILEEVIMV